MIRLGTLIVLACAASVGTFAGRFWVYDRESTCDIRDDVKFILILLDILKDTAVYFMLLSYLLK